MWADLFLIVKQWTWWRHTLCLPHLCLLEPPIYPCTLSLDQQKQYEVRAIQHCSWFLLSRHSLLSTCFIIVNTSYTHGEYSRTTLTWFLSAAMYGPWQTGIILLKLWTPPSIIEQKHRKWFIVLRCTTMSLLIVLFLSFLLLAAVVYDPLILCSVSPTSTFYITTVLIIAMDQNTFWCLEDRLAGAELDNFCCCHHNSISWHD